MASVAPPATVGRFNGTYRCDQGTVGDAAPGATAGEYDAIRISGASPTGYTAELLSGGRVVQRRVVPARYASGYLFVTGTDSVMDHSLTVLTERLITGLAIDGTGRLQTVSDVVGTYHALFVIPVHATHDRRTGRASSIDTVLPVAATTQP